MLDNKKKLKVKNLKSKNNIFNLNFEFLILNFKFIQAIVVVLILLLVPNLIFAQEPNNKFGIHLAQPHLEDLRKAAELVNSSGGDWGYVTLVIQENDRDQKKWQEIFNQLRRLHLIPIIRLATLPEGEFWKRPQKEDVDNWVNFLDSLNWVIKKRYLVLFNEPNHASEWGGWVDPKSYAEVVFELAKKLKEKNPDFFIMLAGFDASAPHQPPKFYDEELFLREVFNFQSSIFNYIDGWASHSYPNPDFSGSPYDAGRGTIRTYQWELQLLKNLGINKDLPVFITETGWENKIKSSKLKAQSYLIEETIANNYKIAFENVWLNDERVKVVTPFVFDYQAEPFLGFSWKKQQSDDFYPQYYQIQSFSKTKGQPEQIEKGEILLELPSQLISQSIYYFQLVLKNQGQGFWDESSGYFIKARSIEKDDDSEYFFDSVRTINPNDKAVISFSLKTSKNTGLKKIYFVLEKNSREIIRSKTFSINILPLPSLELKVNLFPKINDQGDDFEIQIFDKKENLIFNKQNIDVYGGKGVVDEIRNIVLGEKYRIVILKKYYLPRQSFLIFKTNKNKVSFRPMAPVDFNNDGRFSLFDLIFLLKQPKLFKLFLP